MKNFNFTTSDLEDVKLRNKYRKFKLEGKIWEEIVGPYDEYSLFNSIKNARHIFL